MKTLAACSLLFIFAVTTVSAAYDGDNPFVDAMLKTMESFGFISRDDRPPGAPYLPGQMPMSSTFPGMSPPMPWGAMGPWSAPGGWPGAGMSMPPNWNTPWGRNRQPDRSATPSTTNLDGVWELSNGAVVIIRGNTARLYLARDRHQDFDIRYNARDFWWSPRGSDTKSSYRYRVQDGRMVLLDASGKVLLLRRRK